MVIRERDKSIGFGRERELLIGYGREGGSYQSVVIGERELLAWFCKC